MSMIACSHVATNAQTHGGALDASQTDRESEGNRAAIKALLANERKAFRAAAMPINTTERKPQLQSWPADHAGSSSSSPTSAADMTSARLLDLLMLAPPRRTEAYPQAPHVQRLVPTTRSTADDYAHTWPTVPPYTFFAPTGSAYPGTIRCVPDYLGGQRCHQTP